MNAIFARFTRRFVLVFMNDILVFSEDLDSHLEHKLFPKESKCFFAQQQLEYLGHIISAKGVATDPEKTKAMLQWPTPTTVTVTRVSRAHGVL